MTSTAVDRIYGLSSGVAFKAPVRVATTGPITLSGLQTIDGVTLAADDRVLVKDQADTTTNGIYLASTSTWQRDQDFDGGRDVVNGTLFLATSGTVNGGIIWRLSATNPVSFSTSALVFESLLGDGLPVIATGTTASRTLQNRFVDEGFNVLDFGAVADSTGTNGTSSTAAFQAAWNAAKAVKGSVIVPAAPAGFGYRVGAINGTLADGVTVRGAGNGSLIYADVTSGNWWDLSGSSNITFEKFKVLTASTNAPARLWLFAMTNSLVVASHILFDDVTAIANCTKDFFLGYGAADMVFRRCFWRNTKSGASAVNDALMCSVVRFDAQNETSATSAFVTLATGLRNSNDWLIEQSTLSANPAGFGASNHSHNTALCCITSGQGSIINSHIYSNGPAAWVIWDNCENLSSLQTQFADEDGESGGCLYFIEIGGGFNGDIALINPFFSVPDTGGAFVALGPKTLDLSTTVAGGMIRFVLLSPDLGGNFFGCPLIGLTYATSGGSGLTTWIDESIIQCQAGNIVADGSITPSTMIFNPGTITVPTGSDIGSQIGPAWTAYTPTVNTGTGTLTSVSATGRWTRVGKTIHYEITPTITTNGTGATTLVATLPMTAAARRFIAIGQHASSGKAIVGTIASGGSTISMVYYDNSYPGTDGAIITISGTYESA